MLKLTNMKLLPGDTGEELVRQAARLMNIRPADITGVRMLKKSLDSRRKNDVHFRVSAAFAVRDEAQALRGAGGRAEPYTETPYVFPGGRLEGFPRPVIIGAGPAGLFAALTLARAGLPCLLLERGRPVEQRTADVERFWSGGPLLECSNVQYGEGGAGTFSDGKLTCGTGDRRIPHVLETFVRHGAPEEILWLAKPHIGTDRLKGVVQSIRRELTGLGCQLRFETRLEGLDIREGALQAVRVTGPDGTDTLAASCLIPAVGNSARDTFRMFHDAGLAMEAKNFSVGVRIEHRQRDVDAAQYGALPTLGTLPAADYKLAVHQENGRAVYTFCVCPGGQVVAAASRRGTVVTNGMSEYARDRENINGGLLVSVTPADFGGGLFDGMEFQERLEQAAFRAGGGDYRAPAQLVGDFLARRPSTGCGRVRPSYRPGVTYCNLWDVLPPFVCRALAAALPEMEKKIRGFAAPDAVLTAVETRSSSPVRILRDSGGMSNIRGIFPAGEGAGYAGGITSAAVDGIRAAEALAAYLQGGGNA